VSVTEVVLNVRCKSDQRDELKALITSKGADAKKGVVVEQVAAGIVQPVGGMSPASKASLKEMERGMNALIQGQTGAQKTLNGVVENVGKLTKSSMSLKKRLEALEKAGAKKKRRIAAANAEAEVIEDDEDEEEEEEEEQEDAHPGSMRIEISHWIQWQWRAELDKVKEAAAELGIAAQMNYRSKTRSVKMLNDAAHEQNWVIPEGEGARSEDESEAC
jgi:hypothetical protein